FASMFHRTISDPLISVGAQFLFILITMIVVSRGIQNGIEKASRFMMPALTIRFIVLVIRSVTLDGAIKGIEFLFQPDFSKITSKTILNAMGQSFFTLSVGVSVMI